VFFLGPIPLPVENEETGTLEWQDPDRRDRVWLVCQTGVLPARVVQEEVPNKQLQMSLNELSLKSLSDNGTFENKTIKHKGDIKHSDSDGHIIQSKEKQKQCDDISFKTLLKSHHVTNENEKSYSHNPTEFLKTEKELVKVQLEESHEILEVDRRFIEKVSQWRTNLT
jgi:hypothetical protein